MIEENMCRIANSFPAYGLVAQGLEQGTHNPLVVGSNPTGPTNQINALRKQGIFSCRNCVQFVS